MHLKLHELQRLKREMSTAVKLMLAVSSLGMRNMTQQIIICIYISGKFFDGIGYLTDNNPPRNSGVSVQQSLQYR